MHHYNRFVLCVAGGCLLLGGLVPPVRAEVRSKAVQEAVEYAAKKFGWKVGREGLETAAKKLETQAAKHGDDMVAAFRQVGAKSFDVAETHGAKGLKLVARHGDSAVTHVLARPKALGLVTRLGDDAAEALVKHPGIAEEPLEKFGMPAAKALCAVAPRNGRRLAMMAGDGGELAKLGRSDELLGVVGKYGDRAMTFVWDNKATLATAAVLAAFLADPEPFLDGVKDITRIAAENVARPLVESVAQPLAESAAQAVVESVAPEVGKNTNWTAVFLAAVLAPVALVGYGVWRYLPKRRYAAVPTDR